MSPANKDRAVKVRNVIQTLAHSAGLTMTREVRDTVFAGLIDLDAQGYHPPIDCVLSLSHEALGLKPDILSRMTGRKMADSNVPIIGVEIEATMTTKTVQSAWANLGLQGFPYGLIVTDVSGEADNYVRAMRVVRTMQALFGYRPVAAADVSQLRGVQVLAAPVTPVASQKRSTGKERGGGTLWVKLRQQLVDAGNAAGFVVRENWQPDTLHQMFERRKAAWEGTSDASAQLLGREITCDPVTGVGKRCGSFRDLFVGSELDMVWGVNLPAKVVGLLQAIEATAPDLGSHTAFFAPRGSFMPLVGFEFECEPGKHAQGALLNLSAYCNLGFSVVRAEAAELAMGRRGSAVDYSLGRRNVFVRRVEDLLDTLN